MRDLNYQLIQMCRRNRDGGYGTQKWRMQVLMLIANQLHEAGFRHMNVHSLKPKHVEALVGKWLSEGLSATTMKNRMVAIRWWAKKVNRASVVAQSNEFYGIPERKYVTNISKATTLGSRELFRIPDPRVRMSLCLQRAFGLRREEAIKFMPRYADRGDQIVLKGSWTKGGKERSIPVVTREQRSVLDEARRLAGGGSLIPSAKNYRKHLRVYEAQVARAGLSRMHGLRHAYAHWRYEMLAGWPPPAAGGPGHGELTPEQKEKDKEVRQVISRELGHERLQIVSVYCGR